MEPHGLKSLHQPVHILFSHQLKQVFGLGMGRKGLPIQKALFNIFRYINISPVKPLIQ